MIEIGEFLKLLNRQCRLLLIVSICEESHCLLILFSHYVKDTALLGVRKVDFLVFIAIVTLLIIVALFLFLFPILFHFLEFAKV